MEELTETLLHPWRMYRVIGECSLIAKFCLVVQASLAKLESLGKCSAGSLASVFVHKNHNQHNAHGAMLLKFWIRLQARSFTFQVYGLRR